MSSPSGVGSHLRPRPVLIVLAVAGAVSAPVPAGADPTLPAVLSDNMVLQRQTSAPIWGWARPGEKITVHPSWQGGEDTTAVTDGAGKWSVRLKTPDAGGPFTIAVQGDRALTISNVMVGEVWICSGQSNMEWSLGGIGAGREGVPSADDELKQARYPAVRLFTVANTIAASARRDCAGSWSECAPSSAKDFSAVGYFFGRTLHRELNVPIGLISADWGGTPAESWTSEETIRTFPEFKDALDFLGAARDPEKRTDTIQQRLDAWWKALDPAAKGGPGADWARPGFEDSAWKPARVPGQISGDGLESFDGIVYLRTATDIPPGWQGKGATLELGPIDDRDETFFNGIEVGRVHDEGRWNAPRVYTVPADLVKAGKATIAVKVLDTGGPGGLMGKPEQMVLRSSDKALAPIPLAGEWRVLAGPALASLPPIPQSAGVTPHTPTSLYNGMIAPLTPMAIRGVIWYQGESNVGRAAQYAKLFPAMIRDWRARWAGAGAGDFPFYFVQIAPFGYDKDAGQAAELREAQLVSLATPNTGMAVTMDIGNPRDIHPDNKQEVGRRLALWALAKTYAKPGVECSGPVYKSMSVEGDKVRLHFEHGAGLKLMGANADGAVTNLGIAGKDRKFYPAAARVDGDSLVVSGSEVKEPVAVRYCWGAADRGTLFNGAGLPATSFRTDDWQATGKP